MFPDTIGPESTENACFPPLRAATDQKAGGSNPSRRAKTPVKSVDFTGVLFGFLNFLRWVPFCVLRLTHNLTHTGKLLDSTGEETAYGIGRFGLHCGGDVGIGVQCEPCGVVAQHARQGFDVHAVLEGQD